MSAASFAIVCDRLRWMPLDYDFRALPLRRIDGTRKREKKREEERKRVAEPTAVGAKTIKSKHRLVDR